MEIWMKKPKMMTFTERVFDNLYLYVLCSLTYVYFFLNGSYRPPSSRYFEIQRARGHALINISFRRNERDATRCQQIKG